MSDPSDLRECPEYFCGVEMRRDELKAHLQMDHGRSEFRAEKLLEDE